MWRSTSALSKLNGSELKLTWELENVCVLPKSPEAEQRSLLKQIQQMFLDKPYYIPWELGCVQNMAVLYLMVYKCNRPLFGDLAQEEGDLVSCPVFIPMSFTYQEFTLSTSLGGDTFYPSCWSSAIVQQRIQDSLSQRKNARGNVSLWE